MPLNAADVLRHWNSVVRGGPPISLEVFARRRSQARCGISAAGILFSVII
jgi:hypothetical protein